MRSDSIIQRLIPDDLVLPMNTAFSKTFTSKQLSEALKLSRHAPLTRMSPMAMYMSSKGSTSWEASIKSRPTVAQDDVTPTGWKIVENVKEDSSAVDDSKKKSGGLFSFFGRKGTTSSIDLNAKRPASPASTSRAPSIRTASPRPSVDGSRSSTVQTPVVGRTAPSSPMATSFGSASINEKVDAKALPVSPSATETTDNIVRESTPPPSAVSRFLGRFSGRTGRSTSRDSIALSADDLEFLSDVPTAHDDDLHTGLALDPLSMMIRSPPLPTTLPAPLPPPPKPPQVSRAPSQITQPKAAQAMNDDFMSFFDAPNPTSTASVSQLPSATTLNPAPVNPNANKPSQPTLMPGFSFPPTRSTNITDLTQSSRAPSSDDDDSWAAFDYPATPKAMKATPSAPQARRPVVAIMNSSKISATPSPSNSKPSTPFSLPPPPSFSQSRPASNGPPLSSTNTTSSLPPPPAPATRSQAPSLLQPISRPQQPAPAPAPMQIHADDDDDFADFLSSPPAKPTKPLTFGGFGPAPIKTTNIMPQNVSMSEDDFGAFEDFMDPQPPPTPAKPQSLSFTSQSNGPSTTKSIPPTQPQANHSRKPSKKADHSRTISLMETAAARGRWLAPPSPLPDALPAPPHSMSNGPTDFFGSTMQSQQAAAVASFGSSSSSPAILNNGPSAKMASSWNLPPPPSVNSSSLKPTLLAPPPAVRPTPPTALSQPFLSPTPMSNGPASTSGNTGGLSAQDLSFFEGL